MAVLVLIVLSALGVSALCSVLEAGLLSANVVKLAERRDAGEPGAARLLEIKNTRLDDAIAAILTYNTIAHTVGAALAGAQAAHVFGSRWVGAFSAVLTLLILVFTEILPKTLGATHALRLSGFTGRVLSLMVLPPMSWLLSLIRVLTRLIARTTPEEATTRGDVMTMVRLATRSGAIDRDESKVMANLLRLEEIKVRDVMTPRTVVTMLEADEPVRVLIDSEEARAFSRIPLYEKGRDAAVGYVLVRQVMQAALEPGGTERPLRELARPIDALDESLSVGAALEVLQRRGEQIAIVVDELGVLAGLVTLEDLIETLLGREIVDELDEVVDLRQAAIELRDRRMARVRALFRPGS